MWGAHYQPLCGWGRHHIRQNVKWNTVLSKVYQVLAYKVLYHGLLQNSKWSCCLYSWAGGWLLLFHTSSTSLSGWCLRERQKVALEPWLPGSWQTDKERSSSPSDSPCLVLFGNTISQYCARSSADCPSLHLSLDLHLILPKTAEQPCPKTKVGLFRFYSLKHLF